MNRLFCFFVILYVSVSCISTNSFANRAAGGELIYEWISDSTYRFFFRYYNNCAGDTADTVQTLCLYNSCLNSHDTSIFERWNGTMPGGGNGHPGNPGCAQYPTKCSTLTSPIPGYKEYWYATIITLPAKCSLWRFSVTVAERSATYNLTPSGGKNNLYVETTFNNLLFQGNSSPYFTIRPIPYLCMNTMYSYNNGAIDPNGDSIVTEMVRPLTKSQSCSDTPEIIPFASASPALSLPSNPIQTNNTFSINPKTGQLSFIATDSGRNVISTLVKEYRQGVLVGTIQRDILLEVLNCKIDSPQTSLDLNSITGGYYKDSTIYGCRSQQLSFCWEVKGDDTTSIFVLDDNHNLVPALQTATTTYTNNRTDSAKGCFTWTPSQKDSGTYGFIITIKDSTCRPPGIMLYYIQAIPIYIWAPTRTIEDTIVCLGNPVALKTKGGADYTWSVLSGNAGSLSCYNCQSPVANPSINTTYKVVSSASALCGNNEDTVSISVLPSVSSYIKIIASDTSIKEGTKVYVTSLGVNCPNPVYEWQINGTAIPGADSSKLVFKFFKDMDTLTCRLICNDTCASPPDTVSNSIIFHVTPKPSTFISGLNTLSTDFKLFPNPNSGSFTLTGEQVEGEVIINIIDIVGQTVHKESFNVQPGFKKQVNTDNLHDGLYILDIHTDKGKQNLKFRVRH